MTESWLAFDIAVTLYAIIGSRFEERRMTATFGQEYVDYKNRVPSLIPFPYPRITTFYPDGESKTANPKIDG